MYTLVWNGVCFVHQGMYRGGVFKFVMYIPETYLDHTPFNPITHALSYTHTLTHCHC